jgi:predicted tellurium resistance membrane protein TerC
VLLHLALVLMAVCFAIGLVGLVAGTLARLLQRDPDEDT